MLTKRFTAAAALGVALACTVPVLAEPAFTWELGAPNNGDVTTFASGIQISATDLINGLVPLKNNDLAAGWPFNANGYQFWAVARHPVTVA